MLYTHKKILNMSSLPGIHFFPFFFLMTTTNLENGFFGWIPHWPTSRVAHPKNRRPGRRRRPRRTPEKEAACEFIISPFSSSVKAIRSSRTTRSSVRWFGWLVGWFFNHRSHPCTISGGLSRRSIKKENGDFQPKKPNFFFFFFLRKNFYKNLPHRLPSKPSTKTSAIIFTNIWEKKIFFFFAILKKKSFFFNLNIARTFPNFKKKEKKNDLLLRLPFLLMHDY